MNCYIRKWWYMFMRKINILVPNAKIGSINWVTAGAGEIWASLQRDKWLIPRPRRPRRKGLITRPRRKKWMCCLLADRFQGEGREHACSVLALKLTIQESHYSSHLEVLNKWTSKKRARSVTLLACHNENTVRRDGNFPVHY